jgi:SAM-dependent methyltransferase
MNIQYDSDSIGKFYSENRVQWDHFYPSEKYIFEKVFSENSGIKTVLDVGAACGGLGRALHEKFGIEHYTGVDINSGSIDIALETQSNFPVSAKFLCADIAAQPDSLKNKKYDLVVSLSCADWNCDTSKIIQTCWDHTADGGFFIFSFRLTNQKTLSNMEDGYQYVHFSDVKKLIGNEEKAPYVVTNALETMKMIENFQPKPDRAFSYGNWGTPSALAVIPYKEIVFAVFGVRKAKRKGQDKTIAELLLPLDLFVKQD